MKGPSINSTPSRPLSTSGKQISEEHLEHSKQDEANEADCNKRDRDGVSVCLAAMNRATLWVGVDWRLADRAGSWVGDADYGRDHGTFRSGKSGDGHLFISVGSDEGREEEYDGEGEKNMGGIIELHRGLCSSFQSIFFEVCLRWDRGKILSGVSSLWLSGLWMFDVGRCERL